MSKNTSRFKVLCFSDLKELLFRVTPVIPHSANFVICIFGIKNIQLRIFSELKVLTVLNINDSLMVNQRFVNVAKNSYKCDE